MSDARGRSILPGARAAARLLTSRWFTPSLVDYWVPDRDYWKAPTITQELAAHMALAGSSDYRPLLDCVRQAGDGYLATSSYLDDATVWGRSHITVHDWITAAGGSGADDYLRDATTVFEGLWKWIQGSGLIDAEGLVWGGYTPECARDDENKPVVALQGNPLTPLWWMYQATGDAWRRSHQNDAMFKGVFCGWVGLRLRWTRYYRVQRRRAPGNCPGVSPLSRSHPSRGPRSMSRLRNHKNPSPRIGRGWRASSEPGEGMLAVRFTRIPA
ncbi:MAG: hypothetical protein ABW277_18740 [Longimicrobiaceae bacterium]